jgi:hypothetical protein
MTAFDPNDYSDYSSAEPVCEKCFSDRDIAEFIEGFGGPPGCSICGDNDSPTAPLDEVAGHMHECLLQFYGFAIDQLPYEGREGGYQAPHWDTYDLIFDRLGLDLPRDRDDQLRFTLPDRISEEMWCAYDWLSLDYDQELDYAWRVFCRTIQHERRFFFALPKENETEDKKDWNRDRNGFSPLSFLSEIVKLAEDFGMVQILPSGTEFFRSRPCEHDAPYHTAQQLGPPPPDRSVQANRMNPPGISMTYGAETEDIAIRETRSTCVTVGQFRLEREARILDLADLPVIPGIFSGAERRTRLGLVFIHAFAGEIARPVDRSDRIHIEYIPSQVITEFIRDSKIDGSAVDGIRYPSTLDAEGRNLVLFATQDDLMESDGTPVSQQEYPPLAPWIRLIDAHLVEIPVNKNEEGEK